MINLMNSSYFHLTICVFLLKITIEVNSTAKFGIGNIDEAYTEMLFSDTVIKDENDGNSMEILRNFHIRIVCFLLVTKIRNLEEELEKKFNWIEWNKKNKKQRMAILGQGAEMFRVLFNQPTAAGSSTAAIEREEGIERSANLNSRRDKPEMKAYYWFIRVASLLEFCRSLIYEYAGEGGGENGQGQTVNEHQKEGQKQIDEVVVCELWQIMRELQESIDSLMPSRNLAGNLSNSDIKNRLSQCEWFSNGGENLENEQKYLFEKMEKEMQAEIAALEKEELMLLLTTYDAGKRSFPSKIEDLFGMGILAGESKLAYEFRRARIYESKWRQKKGGEEGEKGQQTPTAAAAEGERTRPAAEGKLKGKARPTNKQKQQQLKKRELSKKMGQGTGLKRDDKGKGIAESRNEQQQETLTLSDMEAASRKIWRAKNRLKILLNEKMVEEMGNAFPILMAYDLVAKMELQNYYTQILSIPILEQVMPERDAEVNLSKKYLLNKIWDALVSVYNDVESRKKGPKESLEENYISKLLPLFDGSKLMRTKEKILLKELKSLLSVLNQGQKLLDSETVMARKVEEKIDVKLLQNEISKCPKVRKALWTMHAEALYSLYNENGGDNGFRKFLTETRGPRGRLANFFGNIQIIIYYYTNIRALLDIEYTESKMNKRLIELYKIIINKPNEEEQLKEWAKALIEIDFLARYKKVDHFFTIELPKEIAHNWADYKLEGLIFMDQFVDYNESEQRMKWFGYKRSLIAVSYFAILLEITSDKTKQKCKRTTSWNLYTIEQKIGRMVHEGGIALWDKKVITRKLQQIHEENIREFLRSDEEFRRTLYEMNERQDEILMQILGDIWPEKELGRKFGQGQTPAIALGNLSDFEAPSSSTETISAAIMCFIDKEAMREIHRLLFNAYQKFLDNLEIRNYTEKIDMEIIAAYGFYKSIISYLLHSFYNEMNAQNKIGELINEFVEILVKNEGNMKKLVSEMVYFAEIRLIDNKSLNNYEKWKTAIFNFGLTKIFTNKDDYKKGDSFILKFQSEPEIAKKNHYYCIGSLATVVPEFQIYIYKHRSLPLLINLIKQLIGDKNMAELVSFHPLLFDIYEKEKYLIARMYLRYFLNELLLDEPCWQQTEIEELNNRAVIWHYVWLFWELRDLGSQISSPFGVSCSTKIMNEFNELFIEQIDDDFEKRISKIIEFIQIRVVRNKFFLNIQDWLDKVIELECKDMTYNYSTLTEECGNSRIMLNVLGSERHLQYVHFSCITNLLTENTQNFYDKLQEKGMQDEKLIKLVGETYFDQLQIHFPDLLQFYTINNGALKRMYIKILSNRIGSWEANNAIVRLEIKKLLEKLKKAVDDAEGEDNSNSICFIKETVQKTIEKIFIQKKGSGQFWSLENLCIIYMTIKKIDILAEHKSVAEESIISWLENEFSVRIIECREEEVQQAVLMDIRLLNTKTHYNALDSLLSTEAETLRNIVGIQRRIEQITGKIWADKLIAKYNLSNPDVFDDVSRLRSHYIEALTNQSKEIRALNKFAANIFAWVRWADKTVNPLPNLDRAWRECGGRLSLEMDYGEIVEATPDNYKRGERLFIADRTMKCVHLHSFIIEKVNKQKAESFLSLKNKLEKIEDCNIKTNWIKSIKAEHTVKGKTFLFSLNNVMHFIELKNLLEKSLADKDEPSFRKLIIRGLKFTHNLNLDYDNLSNEELTRTVVEILEKEERGELMKWMYLEKPSAKTGLQKKMTIGELAKRLAIKNEIEGTSSPNIISEENREGVENIEIGTSSRLTTEFAVGDEQSSTKGEGCSSSGGSMTPIRDSDSHSAAPSTPAAAVDNKASQRQNAGKKNSLNSSLSFEKKKTPNFPNKLEGNSIAPKKGKGKFGGRPSSTSKLISGNGVPNKNTYGQEQHDKNRIDKMDGLIAQLGLPTNITPSQFVENADGKLLLAKKYVEFLLKPKLSSVATERQQQQKHDLLDIGALANEIRHRLNIAERILSLLNKKNSKMILFEENRAKWKSICENELNVELSADYPTTKNIEELKEKLNALLWEILNLPITISNSEEIHEQKAIIPLVSHGEMVKRLHLNNLAKVILVWDKSNHWTTVLTEKERKLAFAALFDLSLSTMIQFEHFTTIKLTNWQKILDQQQHKMANWEQAILPIDNQQIDQAGDLWSLKQEDSANKMIIKFLRTGLLMNELAHAKITKAFETIRTLMSHCDQKSRLLMTGSYLLGTHKRDSPIECIALIPTESTALVQPKFAKDETDEMELIKRKLFDRHLTKCYISARNKCRGKSLFCQLCKNEHVKLLQKKVVVNLPSMEVSFSDDIDMFKIKLIFIFLPEHILSEMTGFERGESELSLQKWDEMIGRSIMQQIVDRAHWAVDANAFEESGIVGKTQQLGGNPMFEKLSEHRSTLKLLELVGKTEGRENLRYLFLILQKWAKNDHFFYADQKQLGLFDDRILSLLVTKIYLLYPGAALTYLLEQFFIFILNWDWKEPIDFEQTNDSKQMGNWVSENNNNGIDGKEEGELRTIDRVQEKNERLLAIEWKIMEPGFPKKNVAASVNRSTAKIMLRKVEKALQKLWVTKGSIKENVNTNTNVIIDAWKNWLDEDKMNCLSEVYNHFLLLTCTSEKEITNLSFCEFADSQIRVRLATGILANVSLIVEYFYLNPEKVMHAEKCPQKVEQNSAAWTGGFSVKIPYCTIWLVGIEPVGGYPLSDETKSIITLSMQKMDFELTKDCAQKSDLKEQELAFFETFLVDRDELDKWISPKVRNMDKELMNAKSTAINVARNIFEEENNGENTSAAEATDAATEDWPYLTNEKEVKLKKQIEAIWEKNGKLEPLKNEIDNAPEEKEKITASGAKLNPFATPFVPNKLSD